MNAKLKTDLGLTDQEVDDVADDNRLDILALKALLAEETEIVDRVWRALGISSYEEAGGKAIDELVVELRAHLAARVTVINDCRTMLGLERNDHRPLRNELEARLGRDSAHIAELEAALAVAHRWLSWALDLIDMYDQRVVDLGDPPELVYSEVHEDGKRLARGTLSAPALQRAAKLDRLRREVCGAIAEERETENLPDHSTQAEWEAQDRTDAALAALHAAEQEEG